MYDVSYWNDYARNNESRYSEEFATVISEMLGELQCLSVLEVGCGTGIDLLKINYNVQIFGADLNKNALRIAKKINPRVNFQRCSVAQLPYVDSSIDLVFSHGLLSCLDDTTLLATMSEMHRVARLYIMDCEMDGDNKDIIDGKFYQRDMQARWQYYNLQPIKTQIIPQKTQLVPSLLQLYNITK